MLHDFELQLSDGAEQDGLLDGSDHLEVLDDAFVEQLLKPVLELLVFGRRGVMQIAKHLRRETRNLVEDEIRNIGQRVADAEVAMGDETDDVARIGGHDGFAVLSEELLRVGKAQWLAAAWVVDRHVLFENARADAHEG